MTADGLLSIALGVLIPFLLAVAGGVLAVRTLPESAGRKERFIWIGTFVFLFIVGLVLSFWQQIRTTTHDQTAAQLQKEKDLKAEGEIKFTQGQLDSINKMLGVVISSSAGDSKTFENALLRGAFSASRSSGVEVPAIQRMTNAQLRARISQFTKAMRDAVTDFESRQRQEEQRSDEKMALIPLGQQDMRHQEFNEETQRLQGMFSDFSNTIRQSYFVDATTYKDEIIRRTGPQTISHSDRFITFWTWSYNPFFSEVDALGTADYLDYLVKQLPQ